ncbi:von willebrand factor type A domain protein [Ceratobasidium sp. AG-Ba]|nr:von willebrand factor type A domain protein [Ceratobasidium sp. AG-Ba]QRW08049.1 von willebrand factor type A domain protein [Ceratobasidium sp. AG-Ba]
MGQSSSHSSQDAITPDLISGPMPLTRARSPSASGSRPRSHSGSGSNDAQHRLLRRERRRSRDQTGSTPTSPVVADSPSASGLITSSIPETSTSTPQSQAQTAAQIRAGRRRSSVTTTATAPPPYTSEPAGLEVQLAEAPPPPVPPRERDNVGRRRSTHARPGEKPPMEWLDDNRHRRTMSHSLAVGSSSSTRTASPLPFRAASPPIRQMPPLIPSPSVGGVGVGGFRAEMERASTLGSEEFSLAGGRPSVYSPHYSPVIPEQPAPRTRGSADYHLSPRAPPSRRGSREDPLEMLRRYKTVMVVDDSSSMEGESWAEARDALAGLADAAAKYDQEGIDVHFLNDRRVGVNMKNGVEVKRLFDYVRPNGITPTGQKLEELLLDYMARLEEAASLEVPTLIKPVNFIVITDGAPTDDPESVIVSIARRLDAGHFPLMQVGIQFVQIGTAEDTAEALKELDDGLAQVHGIRDMVDTTPYTGSQFNTELLVKILLGGINRRVDRYGAASVMD